MAPTDKPKFDGEDVSKPSDSPTVINGLSTTSVDPTSDSGQLKEESKVEEVKEEVEETVESLTEARNKILAEHGVESNIGLGHEYWEMGNRLRALLNKVK